jgi:hypothetical protein
VITQQKFVAELQITADMIGRAIEICERERGGDFVTVKRIEGLKPCGRVRE